MYVAGQLAKFYQGKANRMISTLFSRPFVAFSLCIAAMVLAHELLPLDTYLPFRDLSYGLAFACLLAAVADPARGIFQRIFSGRLFDGLGQCSYSLYLLHMPMANGITGLMRLHGITGSRNFALGLLGLPVIILIAHLSYRFVEAPFLKRAQIKHVPAST
jgi:peptidoglycan/LPS O-acetylase OafA/YrhL